MTNEDLKRDIDTRRERLNEQLAKIEHRLTAMEITLWGQRGDNGLRAAIAELRRKIDMLLRFFWIATAIPPLTVGLLGILRFLGKL